MSFASEQSSTNLARPDDHVFGRGHLRQAHRPAGVQFLSGNPDLRPETKLTAIDEPTRCVHEYSCGIDFSGESSRRALRFGDDRFGVAGAVAADVLLAHRPANP